MAFSTFFYLIILHPLNVAPAFEYDENNRVNHVNEK